MYQIETFDQLASNLNKYANIINNLVKKYECQLKKVHNTKHSENSLKNQQLQTINNEIENFKSTIFTKFENFEKETQNISDNDKSEKFEKMLNKIEEEFCLNFDFINSDDSKDYRYQKPKNIEETQQSWSNWVLEGIKQISNAILLR